MRPPCCPSTQRIRIRPRRDLCSRVPMRRDFAGHPAHAKLVSSSVKTPNKRLRSIPPVASAEDPCSLHCEFPMWNSRYRACRNPSRTLVHGCWKNAEKHATLRHIPGHFTRLPDGKRQFVSRCIVIRYDLRFASPGQRENLWRKRPGNGHIRQGVLFSIVSSGKCGWPLRFLTTQDRTPQRRRWKAGKSLNHTEHGEKKTAYGKMVDNDHLKRTVVSGDSEDRTTSNPNEHRSRCSADLSPCSL
jgi:hypothetical protein